MYNNEIISSCEINYSTCQQVLNTCTCTCNVYLAILTSCDKSTHNT